MKGIVGARSHALQKTCCDFCPAYRRAALIYLLNGINLELRICAGCVRSLLFAARTTVKRKARRP